MDNGQTNAVAVVGGGLVGALLATFLVRRGYDVTVYERRDDMRSGPREAGRSINLVLTRRGIRALEQVRLADGALDLTVAVTGRMMHSIDGELAYQPYGRDETECNYSISRAELNEFLVREADKQGVRFRFRSRLVQADLEANRLVFENDSGGERLETEVAALFGADGARSAVRDGFDKIEGFEQSLEMLSHGYKELLIPAADGGGFRIEKNALHIWPRGQFMLMALPNLDGSFTVTLYLPFEGEHGFDSIESADQVMALFRGQFPDAVPLIPDLATSYFDNPTGTLGTLRCRPWHHADRALLIGDAAHAIVPFFGQGMNCGFEDCTVLGELLDRREEDGWAEVFEEFTRLRKPNADAIADMALENFVEMRDSVADRAFLLRKQVEHRLEQEIPLEYRSRYSMVMYSQIPFAVAQEAGRIQQELLDRLCEGLEDAAQLDLSSARLLIRERMGPFLERNQVYLDY